MDFVGRKMLQILVVVPTRRVSGADDDAGV